MNEDGFEPNVCVEKNTRDETKTIEMACLFMFPLPHSGSLQVSLSLLEQHRQCLTIVGGISFFPKEATWLADLEHELATFPVGKHDDQVDSISQFLGWAKERNLGV